MTESISERISNALDGLPAGERKAAQTLIAEYPLIGLKTVAEYAARAGVSSPTILRFISRLGFQNYAEFQSNLQTEVVEQLQSPLARSELRPKTNGSIKLEPFVEAVVENIRETFRHVSEADLDKLAALLGDGKMRLHLIGGRFTDPVARYMAAHLRIIRKDVFHIVGQEANWRDQLVDMGKRDVLVVFDIRRYQDSLVAYAERAAARGVTVVLFTDQWLSPIARVARHVITARTTVPSAWDSYPCLTMTCRTAV
jgi:DNA-binding MurR/RpiR family transcriptional regulator